MAELLVSAVGVVIVLLALIGIPGGVFPGWTLPTVLLGLFIMFAGCAALEAEARPSLARAGEACGPVAAVLATPATQLDAADAATLRDVAEKIDAEADVLPPMAELADAFERIASRIDGDFTAHEVELAVEDAREFPSPLSCQLT